MRMGPAAERWLATAVAGIRFKPDRMAVERELREHFEDKTADLERIFPDMTREEAEERALSQMGDAGEIGKELAKIHRPWLGWLWTASKWVLTVLVVAFLAHCVITHDHYSSWEHPIWGSRGETYGTGSSASPEKVEFGGYTFRVLEAVYLDCPEETRMRDKIRVALRVSSPRFWERVDAQSVIDGLTAVTGDGSRYSMDQSLVLEDTEGRFWYRTFHAARFRWGVFYRDIEIVLDAPWREGDRVVLEFDFAKGNFILETGEIERVVVE